MPNQILFDTEIINPEKPRAELIFFQKPRGCDFCDGSGAKSDGDTNLLQSGMLSYPNRHAVTGFGCYPEFGIPAGDLARIINGAVFEFKRGGTSVEFSQPLLAFPNFLMNAELENGEYLALDPTQDQIARAIYPFKNGNDAALIIGPGMAFNVLIRWPKPPSVSVSIRLTVAIDGYSVEQENVSRPVQIGSQSSFEDYNRARDIFQETLDRANAGRTQGPTPVQQPQIPTKPPPRQGPILPQIMD